jgi:hypothetical protein
MDEAKTLVQQLTKEMIDRSAQYVKDIQAILES